MDHELVKERLIRATGRRRMSLTKLAVLIDRDRNYFRDFTKKKKASLSPDALVRAAKILGVDAAWLSGNKTMYLDLDDPPAMPSRPAPSLPVYKAASVGADGRFVFDRSQVSKVPCPPQLDGVTGAYALQISGESLEPRFRSGETIYLDPARPPRAQSDIIARVEIDGTVFGIVGKYVSFSDKLVMHPSTNAKAVSFPRESVQGVDVIRLIEI
jgi:phage repressor protein C with HTH and peptisase S24 domain